MESMGGSFVEYYSDRRMHVFLLQTGYMQSIIGRRRKQM